MSTNQVKIKKLDNQGRGITYYDDKIMFVNNALPDEIVSIKNINFKKKYYEADMEEVLEESKNRIVPKCPYYKKCGGCNLMHMNYELQKDFKITKIKEILNKYAGIEPEVKLVENDKTLFYRNKITLKVEDGVWGYFSSKTHNLTSINNCLLAANVINDIIGNHDFINIISGEITIRSNYEDKVLISVITKDEVELKEELIPENICGIVVNNKTIYKDNYFYDYIDNYKFKVSYNSFFQVNNFIAGRIFNILEGNLSGNNLLDLYCGVGTLGISVSKKFNNVYGIEINENAIYDAKHNAEINNLKNANYYCGSTDKILSELNVDFDTIIVDPPRSGLNKETIDLILNLKPKNIAYISCDPTTFARDLKVLKDEYSIKKVNVLEMFPNTFHTECVVLMSRSDTDKEKYGEYFMNRTPADIMREYGEQKDEWR